jgi:transcriptional regulator with XRE-family HTH domain
MATGTRTNASKYGNQRQPKAPPHLPLKYARAIAGITAEELCRRIREEDPTLSPTRGTISAIETGTRGASPRMLAAICAAYGLPPDAIVTDYEPVRRRRDYDGSGS